MTALLEVDGLRVRFPAAARPLLAVNGLSFRLDEDEVLAIVGESGCGKTLTGLSVLGLEPPGARVEGRVLFRGRDLRALRTSDARQLRSLRGNEIAMVFQEPMTSLNPALTVGYQTAEVLRQHQGLTSRAARERVAELFGLVRMPAPRQHLRDYPHQLSGGMRQRVVIAMAIACEPAVLIADEPTTSLDPTIQAQILDLLLDLKSRLGMSVLLITHNLGVVARMADRVLVMYAGHKVEEAAAADALRRPRHPYTAGLLNAVPQPGASRHTRRLEAIGGMVPVLRQAPESCVFSPRCPLVTDDCRIGQPELRELGRGHLAACIRAGHTDREEERQPT